jgi:hypothetical protein
VVNLTVIVSIMSTGSSAFLCSSSTSIDTASRKLIILGNKGATAQPTTPSQANVLNPRRPANRRGPAAANVASAPLARPQGAHAQAEYVGPSQPRSTTTLRPQYDRKRSSLPNGNQCVFPYIAGIFRAGQHCSTTLRQISGLGVRFPRGAQTLDITEDSPFKPCESQVAHPLAQRSSTPCGRPRAPAARADARRCVPNTAATPPPAPHRVRPNAGRHPRRRGTARRVHRRPAPVHRASTRPLLPPTAAVRHRITATVLRLGRPRRTRAGPGPAQAAQSLQGRDCRHRRDTALIRRMSEPGGMHHARTRTGCSGHRTRRTAGTPWPCLPTLDGPRSSRPHRGTCGRRLVFQPLTRA